MPSVQGTDNRFLTDDVIAAEALRLLKNNLVAARHTHRDHEKRFGNIGDTISIKLPFRTKSESGRVLSSVSPMVDMNTSLVIDKQEHVGFTFNQIDRTLSISQFSERYLKSGIVQLAHAVDKSVLDCAVQSGFYGSGTPGTGVDSDFFNYARAYMEEVGVPMDGNIAGFVRPLDRAGIEVDVKTLFNEKLVSDAVRRAFTGELAEMMLWSTAQVPVHTVGAHGGTPLVNGASQTGASLVTDGWTISTAVLNKGDVFTIAGVYEVNPQTYESTGRLQRFVVTSAVTSSGAGAATISISPSINDGTLTTVDGDGASVSLAAYQNVSAAPADNAAITVIGTASTAYRQVPIWHRDAIALAVVDIALPEAANVKARARDEDTGLSIAMTAAWDGTNYKQTYRLDVLWGVKAVYGELIHRGWSGANA